MGALENMAVPDARRQIRQNWRERKRYVLRTYALSAECRGLACTLRKVFACRYFTDGFDT
jgi:hypothetical protein